MLKKRKIAIIGLGHVGTHCAYALALSGLVDELVFVDNKEAKLRSEVQDIRDAIANCPHTVAVNSAGYGDLADVDIIVNAIGKIELLATPNHDRLDEMNFTIPQVTDYVPKVIAGGFNGIWINITNPCDVVTGQIGRLSGLPRNHVFGTGTGLDTARLKNILYLQTGVAHNSISSCMMGEHGNSIMIPWSQISFGGQPLKDLAKKDSRFVFDNDAVKKQAVANAWVTVDGKGCTEYGICTALCRLVAAIVHDEKAIIPVSTLLDGEYGEHGVYVGVPAVIGADGVEEIIEYDLPEDEMAAFKACCADVRENMKLNPLILQD